jgi:hypothetical protein
VEKPEPEMQPALLSQIGEIVRADEDKNRPLKAARRKRSGVHDADAPLPELSHGEIRDYMQSLHNLREAIQPGKLWRDAISMFIGELLQQVPIFEACMEAFNKSRSTVFLWKQKLKKAKGRIAALAPGDRTPVHKRRRIVHPFLEDFIIRYRTDHPGADKTIITPLLIATCSSAGIRPVSESTVGRIIHDLKSRGRLPKSNKVSINARSGNLIFKQRQKYRKKERRKDFHPQIPGDVVQMDTVSVFACGIKRYIFTAIDISTRFAFACAYPSNSSINGSDFLRKFVNVAPFNVIRVQTDNGGEFEK